MSKKYQDHVGVIITVLREILLTSKLNKNVAGSSHRKVERLW